jgi:hypothetical protein
MLNNMRYSVDEMKPCCHVILFVRDDCRSEYPAHLMSL